MRRTPAAPRWDFWLPAVAVVVAFFLRTHYVRDWVFAPFGTRFLGNDAWYHMRLIENLAANFPWRITVDPLRLYPALAGVGVAPLFDYLVVIVALVLSGGTPSPALVETVAAYAPAVLGAATCGLAYLLAARLWGRFAGGVATMSAALASGPFLARSRLGFADHHAAEAFFSLLAILALTRALRRPRSAARAAAAGLATAAYMLAWVGGFILPLVLLFWAAAHYLLQSWRGAPTGDFTRTVTVAVAVALPPVFLLQQPLGAPFWMQVMLLVALPLMLLGFGALRALCDRARVPRGAFAVLAATAVAFLLALAYALRLAVVRPLLSNFGRLNPTRAARTVGEVQPLLTLGDGEPGGMALGPAWDIYGVSFVLALAGLALLGFMYLRRRRSADLLVAVWGAATLVLVLGQNRFGYYFAVSAALLAGLVCGELWKLAGRLERRAWRALPAGERGAGGAQGGGVVAGAHASPGALPGERGWAARALIVALVVAGVLLPSVPSALATASARSGPSDEWVRALTWMRNNTAEPFGPGTYLAGPAPGDWSRLRSRPRPRRTEGYGVMSWWDYGYWILRIAHRAPNANPTQAGARRAARFYTATDPAQAGDILAAEGSRYVLADAELPLLPRDERGWPAGKLEPMTRWLRSDGSELFEVYYEERRRGRLDPVMLFYPDYYRTMAVRLALYGGRAVRAANNVWVVSWEPVEVGGRTVKKIVRSRRFRSEQEALLQLVNLDAGNHRIVGRDPLRSPVALDAVEGLRLVYETPPRSGWRGLVPAVRVFRVTAASP